MPVLKFDQVTLRAAAGIVEIIKAVSFEINEGDFVAMVGPSGAGKTSLLRLMNRLIEVSAGTIYLEGQNIQQLPVVALRRQVALVNQESRLLGMTVQDALAYPLQLRGRSPNAIASAVADWSARLNIPADWMNRTEVDLSLGQRQRVAIARTLITEPKILLLDEPTASQDLGYSEFLLTRLSEWAAEGKLTVIMANHQIDLAATHVNRLLHLKDGQLIADLPAAKVDWADLRQTLVEAEQRSEAEWGD
ncbi:MAG: ABC-type D-methionine uptake system ATPase component MetN [Phormidesmis priestleyi Ana]|uniref:ABC-type D-methionine uptake system ATPase component MetN n=1 Tax=Phormidesmis priestleyi Ana TaxID=1666911 RepID=A0A0P7ZI36_9CYAN|nr:MAG: ABC-type D-methionine uptake system ATPase component MetN [Phormidesmis priestleyi Ana]